MPRAEWNPRLVSNLLKHMTIAVFKKNTGREVDRFLDALCAARTTLVKLGMATGPVKGSLKGFTLTSKGAKQDREHRKEGRDKSRQFDALFKKYRSELEVDEVKDDEGVEGADSETERND